MCETINTPTASVIDLGRGEFCSLTLNKDGRVAYVNGVVFMVHSTSL